MDDLLQLKKPAIKIIHDNADGQNAPVIQINQTEQKHQQQQSQSEAVVKCKEKSNVNHKRPSLTHDIISSKRAKGQETIKATPQLMQQLLATTGCNQKIRVKSQSDSATNNTNGWPSTPKSQQPVSNSVLMNLLVSGCDVSAGYYTCLPRAKVAKA